MNMNVCHCTPNKLILSLTIPLLLLCLPTAHSITPFKNHHHLSIPRGGSSSPSSTTTTTPTTTLQTYLLDQHHLHTLRATLLTEYLATNRNLPLHTLQSIQTPDGAKPPQPTDWDCALSTPSSPKSCLYSFEAQSGTKVVAPIGTDQWITLSALNRLRRTDPTKVQPMWHDKYAVLRSWFEGDGEFSLLTQVGLSGFIVSHVLLDHPVVLKVLLGGFIGLFLYATLPVWDYVINKFLCSGLLWRYYKSWGRIVHAALPLKLLLAQMAWKFAGGRFDLLENYVRSVIVDIECGILEERVPITVGMEVEEQIEESDEEDGQEEEEESDEYEYEE